MPNRYKYEEFGNILRRARKLKYESIRSFASDTGISSDTIYQYEIGRTFPPIDNFIAICKALNKSPTYFLAPYLELSKDENEILFLFEGLNIKEIFKDPEVSRIMKFTLLGFSIMYEIKKHFGYEGDIIEFLYHLREKLFDGGQIKKIK